MSSNTPTKEQLRAIAGIDKSLPVTAGAGSGKTFVLTHRYFQILAEKKAALNEILTITFTEKAASQMKQKIRNLITDYARGDAASDFPPVQKPDLTLPDRTYWQELLDNFEQSYISTIHGFCSRILRESAITVGLDPEFTVMDEHTTALRQPEIIRRSVFQLIHREDDAVARWLQYYSASQIIQKMQAMIQQRPQYQGLLDYYMDGENNPVNPDMLFRDIRQRYRQTVIPIIEKCEHSSIWLELKPLIQNLQNYDPEDRFYPHYLKILELIDKLDSNTDPIEQTNIWIALADELKSKGSKQNWSEDFSRVKSLALDFRRDVLESALKGIAVFHEDDEREAIRLAQAGARIYAYVLEKYQSWKRQQNFMDYDDLLISAVELLRDHEDIRREYVRQFRHVLVDEFQDTNPVQYELVQLLQKGKGANSPKIFVVGDPKQSIYRFRGTDVSLFHKAKQQLLEDETQLSMSFRSQPPLLRWFDASFSTIMGTEPHGLAPYEQPYLPLSAYRETINNSLTTNVTVQIVETRSDADEDTIENKIQVEAAHIANWLAENLSRCIVGTEEDTRNASFADVAILLRRTTHLKQYEYALQLADIPFYTVAGKGLFAKQEIQDIVNVLRALTSPGNSIAVVGVLRSALFGVSDESLYRLALSGYHQDWADVIFKEDITLPETLSEQDIRALRNARENIQRWKTDLDRMTPGRLIDRICIETGYLGVVGAGDNGLQQIRNVEQFMEFAYEYGRSQVVSVRGFVEYIATLQEQSEAEEAELYAGEYDAVQLMTIHKSKGLEFPIVIVPNIDNTGNSGMQHDFYPDLGWAISWHDPTRTGDDQKVKPFLYHLIAEEEKRRELAESKRLFYVASTRARDHLILSGIVDGKDALAKNIEKVDYGEDHWMRWTLGALVKHGWQPGRERLRINDTEISVLHHQHTESGELPGAADLVLRMEPAEASEREIPKQKSLSATEIDERWRIPSRPYAIREIKPTMLPVFKNNREGFYQSEILKIPQQGTKDLTAPSGSGTEYGALAHTVLERYVNNPDSDPERTIQAVLQSRQYHNRSNIEESLQTMLSEFVRSDLYKEIKEGNARTEVTILTAIDGIPLSGQIDLLIERPDGTYIVVDYKTDSLSQETPESKVEYYTPQVLAYAYAVYRSTGKIPVRTSIYFTRLRQEYHVPVNRDAFADLEALVEDMVAFVRTRSMQDNPQTG